jgi:inward rectifier potassium channel
MAFRSSPPPRVPTTPAPSDPRQNDLGFGAVVARESRLRLLNRDGSFNTQRDGQTLSARLSPYHTFLTMRWSTFMAYFVGLYLVLNAIFAVGYCLIGPNSLSAPNIGPMGGRYWMAFFFSVETFATIGYGNIIPNGFVPNMLVVVESIFGILYVALATGLIFSRFSRPTALIRFSQYAVIAPYHNITAFEFRIVNERKSELVNLESTVSMTRFETVNGVRTRTFNELKLERPRVQFFSLTLTVVHPIDETSPLFGNSYDELLDSQTEFLIMLTATEETFNQQVHTRSSYTADELRYGMRFGNVFVPPDHAGVVRIDMRLLDRLEPAALPTPTRRDDGSVSQIGG